MTDQIRHDNQCAEDLLTNVTGSACGDKGYLGKKIGDDLVKKVLKLMARKRKDMKHSEKLSDYEK